MGSKLVAGVNGNQVILEPPPPLSSATPEQAKVSSASTASSSLLEAALSAGDRGRPHKFTFDFAHWSHDRNDANFATQEKVFNDLGKGTIQPGLRLVPFGNFFLALNRNHHFL